LPIDPNVLREHATDVARRLGVVGAQVAVLDGAATTAVSVGVENAESNVPTTDDTLFQIGSTTKVFTAALVMQLVDEERIDLDTPVAHYLPEIRFADVEATRSITPRQLMSMGSGLDNGPYTDHGPGPDAVRRYVEALSDLPQVFAPGSGYSYSNASTVVSGYLVERLTGMEWDRALRERLLDPAGVPGMVTLPDDVIHRRFAVGHVRAENGNVQVLHARPMPRAIGPAGSTLWSTATDLVRFARTFLDGGLEVLSAAAVDAMHAPQIAVPPTLLADHWGLGPYRKTWDGVVLHGHSGTTTYGSSYLLWVPSKGFAIATVVNTPTVGYPFADEIFARVLPDLCSVHVPDKPKPVEGLSLETDRLVGTYTMSDSTITVTADGAGGVLASIESSFESRPLSAPSPLLPISPTVFLASDPMIDGGRGWGLAFLGTEEGPATHLVNGFFAMRRKTT